MIIKNPKRSNAYKGYSVQILNSLNLELQVKDTESAINNI